MKKTMIHIYKVVLTVLMAVTCMACSNADGAFQQFADHFSDTAAFSYTTLGGRKLMLVSQEVFGNNVNTDLQAIEASIFAQDTEGKIVALGSIRSQGTLYPVSVANDKLMVAGHHFVRIYSIRGEVPELVLDTYEEGDGPALDALFRTFEQATPLLFEKKH